MKIVEQTSNRLKLQANGLIDVIWEITLFSFFPIVAVLMLSIAEINFFYACLLIVLSIVTSLLFFIVFTYKKPFLATWTFDKSLNLVKREERSLQGKKITKWQLKEIKNVEVEEDIVISDKGDYKRYNLEFEMKSEGRVPIYFLGVTSKKQHQKWANLLCTFLYFS
jgi:hypothetical protein